jgi:FtsZ-binding cell division protein ZapB
VDRSGCPPTNFNFNFNFNFNLNLNFNFNFNLRVLSNLPSGFIIIFSERDHSTTMSGQIRSDQVRRPADRDPSPPPQRRRVNPIHLVQLDKILESTSMLCMMCHEILAPDCIQSRCCLQHACRRCWTTHGNKCAYCRDAYDHSPLPGTLMQTLLRNYPRPALCGEMVVGDPTAHQNDCVACLHHRLEEVDALNTRIGALDRASQQLTTTNGLLRDRVEEYRNRVQALENRTHNLEEENERLRRERNTYCNERNTYYNQVCRLQHRARNPEASEPPIVDVSVDVADDADEATPTEVDSSSETEEDGEEDCEEDTEEDTEEDSSAPPPSMRVLRSARRGN